MSRRATPTRVLLTYSFAGLAMSTLVAYALVWSWLDAYRWNPDGTLNRYPFALRPKSVQTDPASGASRVIDPPGALTRSERVRIGNEESAPILVTLTSIGFCAGLGHLRIRDARVRRTLNPEQQDYVDQTREPFGPRADHGPA